MASRGTAIKAVLNEPSAAVVCVKPSGDCFYECIDRAFATGGLDVRHFEGVRCVGHQQDDGSKALRYLYFASILRPAVVIGVAPGGPRLGTKEAEAWGYPVVAEHLFFYPDL